MDVIMHCISTEESGHYYVCYHAWYFQSLLCMLLCTVFPLRGQVTIMYVIMHSIFTEGTDHYYVCYYTWYFH